MLRPGRPGPAQKLKLAWEPTPQQQRFLDCGAAEQLFGGAKRGGKTVAGAMKAILLSAYYQGNRGLIARKDFTDLRDSTLATFFRVCPPEMLLDHRKVDREIVLRSCGRVPSTILYRGLGDSADVEKAKGIDLGWLWIDEPSEVEEDAYLMLRAQLTWTLPWNQRPRYMAMLTSNPEPGWVKRRFIDAMVDGGAFIPAKPADNPHLPDGWESELRGTMDEEWSRKYLDGSWNVGENSVFPELDAAAHDLRDVDARGMRIVAAMDHGTTGVTACVVVGVDADENIYALDEYYERNRLVSEHAAAIRSLLALYGRIEYVLIDPSTEAKTLQGQWELGSVLDEYRRHGLNATPAHRASIEIGIGLLRELLHASPLHRHPRSQALGSPRLFLRRDRCPNLWREMVELRKTIRENGRTEYVGGDHALDCLRYIAMSRPKAAEMRAREAAELPRPEQRIAAKHAAWAKRWDRACRGGRVRTWY